MLRSSRAADARARPGHPRAQDADRHVGARVRERRIALGLTQQQLAELVGITYQQAHKYDELGGITYQQAHKYDELVGITYQQAHKYEKGLNRIAAGRLAALARALAVEPGHFFEGLGEGEPARPTAQQRRLLELARSFAVLPRRQQEAITELARALAEEAAPGQEGDDEPA